VVNAGTLATCYAELGSVTPPKKSSNGQRWTQRRYYGDKGLAVSVDWLGQEETELA